MGHYKMWGAPFAPVSPRVAQAGSHTWSSSGLSFLLLVAIHAEGEWAIRVHLPGSHCSFHCIRSLLTSSIRDAFDPCLEHWAPPSWQRYSSISQAGWFLEPHLQLLHTLEMHLPTSHIWSCPSASPGSQPAPLSLRLCERHPHFPTLPVWGSVSSATPLFCRSSTDQNHACPRCLFSTVQVPPCACSPHRFRLLPPAWTLAVVCFCPISLLNFQSVKSDLSTHAMLLSS